MTRFASNGYVEFNSGYLGWWERSPIYPKPDDEMYRVVVGDTIHRIAVAKYGDRKFWELICIRNKIIDPTSELVVGSVLFLPQRL